MAQALIHTHTHTSSKIMVQLRPQKCSIRQVSLPIPRPNGVILFVSQQLRLWSTSRSCVLKFALVISGSQEVWNRTGNLHSRECWHSDFWKLLWVILSQRYNLWVCAGVLQSMGSRRVRHNTAIEQQQLVYRRRAVTAPRTGENSERESSFGGTEHSFSIPFMERVTQEGSSLLHHPPRSTQEAHISDLCTVSHTLHHPLQELQQSSDNTAGITMALLEADGLREVKSLAPGYTVKGKSLDSNPRPQATICFS